MKRIKQANHNNQNQSKGKQNTIEPTASCKLQVAGLLGLLPVATCSLRVAATASAVSDAAQPQSQPPKIKNIYTTTTKKKHKSSRAAAFCGMHPYKVISVARCRNVKRLTGSALTLYIPRAQHWDGTATKRRREGGGRGFVWWHVAINLSSWHGLTFAANVKGRNFYNRNICRKTPTKAVPLPPTSPLSLLLLPSPSPLLAPRVVAA